MADVEAAVHVLLAVPRSSREALARMLCQRANAAEEFRQAHDIPHPTFGTGTLMSATGDFQKAPRDGHKPHDFLACISVLVTELAACCDHQTS